MAIVNQEKCVLVTGGAGFIGSCFVRRLFANSDYHIINLDMLTYAGNLDSVPASETLPEHKGGLHHFVEGDIGDKELVADLLDTYRPSWIVNFAAESHVDRSIDDPSAFVHTNVLGTSRLLDATTDYWRELPADEKQAFRFLHVSTDEVYGSLGAEGQFREDDPYRPNSPYAASKAASDMFVRAYRETYGTPTMISNCSNNYGPNQFPEKLIPLIILNTLEGKPLPIYGDGSNIRDWLYVEDHCEALELILQKGRIGETYNIGGSCERTNLELVKQICQTIDRLRPDLAHVPCEQLITFVADRPGHDKRYAVNTSKIEAELGWKPRHDIHTGLEQTIAWYLDNPTWVERVCAGSYRRERLGRSHSQHETTV